jgi:hypothetical protein
MRNIPDIVFLMLGLAYLIVLLSIRNTLRRIAGRKRKKQCEWSLEDQLKHRVKYLNHCRHINEYLNNHKQNKPARA